MVIKVEFFIRMSELHDDFVIMEQKLGNYLEVILYK